MFLSYEIVYQPFFNYAQMLRHIPTKLKGKGKRKQGDSSSSSSQAQSDTSPSLFMVIVSFPFIFIYTCLFEFIVMFLLVGYNGLPTVT
jgi:hypothetical protein